MQTLAAAQSQRPVNEIFASLDQAIKANDRNPDYAGYKIDILLQLYNQTKDEKYYGEAVALLQRIRQSEPNNRMLLEKEIYTLTMKNELDKALVLVTGQLDNFPWDISLYEKNVAMNLDLGNRARLEKNDAKKDQYWN